MAKANPHALRFNGNGYVKVDGLFNIINTSNFSFGFYLSQTTTGNHIVLESNLGNNGFHFQISSTGNLQLGVSLFNRISSSFTINDGVPRYVVGTYNRISQALKLYIDGELIGTITVSMPTMTNLLIGSRSGSFGLYGMIDAVSVWNVELSQEEVELYMNKKIQGSENGLISYWAFDEGNGNIVNDPISNNTGTIYNNVEWIVGEVDLARINILIRSSDKIRSMYSDALIYPNIINPSQLDFETYGLNDLHKYNTIINKVKYEMNEYGELDDGRVIRKILNKNDYNIKGMVVK